SRSGQLDKRPALEYLIGIDRKTGAYIPELAEAWEMTPDGKAWTFTLRKGIKFHENWGEFTARDVRHAIFLITQPESVQTDGGYWRTLMGIEKSDTIDTVAKKVEQQVDLVNDHKVIIRTKLAAPELIDSVSANMDLPMESKARWDAGGKELYGKKVIGTGPFEFVERKVGEYVLYKRVENHWRHTPQFRELEFRWVSEGVTRLATLVAGEVHISDVDRSLQKDAVVKGMKIVPSQQIAVGHEWLFGGMYFATPDKLQPKHPFTDKRVRQAMNMAINRKAIADTIMGGKAQPMLIARYHDQADAALWPGIWNPEWDKRVNELYGYNPTRAKALLAEAGYKNGFEFNIYLYTLPGLPELLDIGQALALDWQAVGLQPKLVELEFPRVREQYRTKAIHGAIWGLRGSPNALNLLRVFNRAKDSTVYAYDHPFIEEKFAELDKTADPKERANLLRQIGDHKFFEFAEMPLFWLFADAAVNPKVIAEYTFPGSITGFFTHLEYVTLAP
ncbi:MAG: ABC transporter substrate-binding protein, partial [Candidatus Tectomicrobia bacterium]|nr:ABC transporter substrate-binding protein [Candidatus Tectomicrobia bacterium]